MVCPGCTSMISPPRACISATPEVTCSVCPTACECQAVCAPGANRTRLTIIRDGSALRVAIGSTHTSPVNQSAEPLAVGSFGSMFIWHSFSLGRDEVDYSCRSTYPGQLGAARSRQENGGDRGGGEREARGD